MPIWLAPVFGFLGPLLDRFFPDKTKQAEFTFELQKLAATQAGANFESDLKLALGQTQVNLAEAQSKSLFASGWRPFIGWICGAAFCYNFLIDPLLTWMAASYDPTLKIPAPLDLSTMLPVLFGMLGLGSMRSYERVKGKVPMGK